MTTISKDSVVSFKYTLTNSEGQTLDQSAEPLAYLHGHSQIIPGLEKELEGRSAGEALQVTVEPAEAYGEIDESMIHTVPRAMFQGVDNIEPGMQFESQTDDGAQIVTVKQADENEVIVDANHPLAGQTLNFDVEIVEVRAATEDELSHGHAHGAGGHHH